MRGVFLCIRTHFQSNRLTNEHAGKLVFVKHNLNFLEPISLAHLKAKLIFMEGLEEVAHSHSASSQIRTKQHPQTSFPLIETILKVKKSVIQTLADLNNGFIITDQDFDTLEMIRKSLKPVKRAAKALCRRDATLLVVEGIFRFLLKQLQRHNHNWLSQALYVAILKRVQERRQRNVVSLMRFLSCPSTLTQHDNESFTMPTHLNIQKCARSLMLQLLPLYRPDDSDPYTDGGSRETDVNGNAMHKEKLEDQLEQSILLATTQKTGSDDEYKSIAKDMLAYEASGKRPKSLDLLMDALESIPPTSVESERIFSITGKILTKQRA